MQIWEKVIWSDETKVEQFRRNIATSFWRKNGTAFKKHNTTLTVKFWGGSIMIWGCFTTQGTGELQVIHGRMNGSMYREILEMNIQKSFNTKIITNIPQNLQKNDLKIMVLALSIG